MKTSAIPETLTRTDVINAALKTLQHESLDQLRGAFPIVKEAVSLIFFARSHQNFDQSFILLPPAISLLRVAATVLGDGPNKEKLLSVIKDLSSLT